MRVTPAADDEARMDEALALAARGRGATSPNPMVGAVITLGGRTLGRGYHVRAGAPHAEVMALNEAGESARGARLYCTLEPCCHTGRTGPCVERVVRAGLREVIVAVEDPNPRVDGAGLAYLRNHGVAVSVGLRRAAATRLNEGFFTVQRRSRPFVTMKAAVSLDGCIAAAPGQRTPLTGPASSTHAQAVRATVDAIAVGSGTVCVDDPLLTARGVARARPLVRVLFDTRMRTSPTARIFGTLDVGPVLVMTSEPAVDAWPRRAAALEAAGAVIEALPARDPALAISRLVAHDVCDLLVEGGAVLHRAIWDAKLVDRVRLYVAPVTLGPGAVPWMTDGGFSMAAYGGGEPRRLGDDVLLEADVQRVD
jgi:diaminohydroxyphosphoribosylaminopyrimidine deaminase/5-amino-6-(5-phosphoribosylamino)uracil reductase